MLVATMDKARSVPLWRRDAFPPVDPRIACAVIALCILLSALLIGGLVTVQLGALPRGTWLAIVAAQILTALVVGRAVRLSSPNNAASDQGPAARDGR
jgi:hypothetical protein